MLHRLTDEALMIATKRASKVETTASVNVVRHYFEINRRELHLKHAKPNLFAFIVAHFEMDTTSVQRRVNAVKLACAVPKLLDFIDQGELGLSSAADIQTFLNAESGRRNAYSDLQKRELVESLLGKSTRKIQQSLSKRNPAVQFTESKKQISENQYKITYVSSVETEQKFERLKEIRSHVNPHANRDELLNYIFELALEKIDPERKAHRAYGRASKKASASDVCVETRDCVETYNSVGTYDCELLQTGEASALVPAPEKNSATENVTAKSAEEVVSEFGEIQYVMNFANRLDDVDVEPAHTLKSQTAPRANLESALEKRSRYIPARERYKVQHESGGCCAIDEKTGERCGSRYLLQFDHVESFSQGGANTAENGQMLCGSHNRYKFRRKFVRDRTLNYTG